MAETFAVPVKGVGKPDYTREVALGQVRPGLTLKYGQTLKIAGICASALATPYPGVVPPIAPGGFANLIDWETGLPLPYSFPAGYTLTLIQRAHSGNQDYVVRLYFDGFFLTNLGTSASGLLNFTTDVVAYSTLAIDPTAARGHSIDVRIANLGGGNFEGACTIVAIQEALGTPPLPKDKTVRCKFCGHEWVVPRETTAIECPNCHKLNIYFDLSRVRSIG